MLFIVTTLPVLKSLKSEQSIARNGGSSTKYCNVHTSTVRRLSPRCVINCQTDDHDDDDYGGDVKFVN